ncbi:MAG: hypothetical protein JXA60_04040 [Candidatus Coatesbacteria bacterium]|nr:hypothetical protein [Candidatus Coatesbacteria bacterium]
MNIKLLLLLLILLPFLLNAEMAYKEWLDTCRRQFEAKRKEARLDEKRGMERINEQMNTFIPVNGIIRKKLGFMEPERSGINSFHYEDLLTVKLCYSIVLCRARIISIDKIKPIEVILKNHERMSYANIICTAEILEIYWGKEKLKKEKSLKKIRFGLNVEKWRTRTQGMIDTTPCVNDEILLPLHHYEKNIGLFFGWSYDLIVNSEKSGKILKCKDISFFDRETPFMKIEKIITDIKMTGNELRKKEGLKPL